MTLLHLAEVRTGSRPFVRWANDLDGLPSQVFVVGCSEGFERLGATLQPFERQLMGAKSLWRIQPGKQLPW